MKGSTDFLRVPIFFGFTKNTIVYNNLNYTKLKLNENTCIKTSKLLYQETFYQQKFRTFPFGYPDSFFSISKTVVR